MDRFEGIVAAETDLARHFDGMRRVWHDTARGVEAIRTLCGVRQRVQRVAVTVTGRRGTVELDLGPVSVCCAAVPAPDAAETVRVAGLDGVDLHVAGFAPSSHGWSLGLAAHCGTPVPFRVLSVPMRAAHLRWRP